MAYYHVRERGVLMAWIIRKNNNLMFAGITASDAIDNFIAITKYEDKAVVSEAVKKFNMGRNIRVKGYTLKWE
jgi:hypothetical protein